MASQFINARTVLITGANRGLGLTFASKLLSQPTPPSHLICACRAPDAADELKKLQQSHRNVHLVQVDMKDPSTFLSLSDYLNRLLGDGGLNLLINNAGIFPGKPQDLSSTTQQVLEDSFKTNVIGPLLLTKELLPLLRMAAKKQQSSFSSCHSAAVVNLTSGYGSTSLNKTGALYAYGSSKAALNMITKSLAIDLKKDGILAVAISPGWVKTDMGGPQAPLTTEKSVTRMLETLGKLTAEHSGLFIDLSGKVLPY